MKNWFEKLLAVMMDIYDAICEMKQQKGTPGIPLEERRLWAKEEVKEKLKMTDATYKRNKKSGLLMPIRLNGIDEYYEEDLLKAIEQSRRKGRI